MGAGVMQDTVCFEYEDRDVTISGLKGDHIFEAIRRNRTFYELALLRELRAVLGADTDGLAIDAGANIGNHSVFFAAIMGLTTLAIEPQEKVTGCLSANRVANGLVDKMRISFTGVSDREGFGRIEETNPRNTGSSVLKYSPPENKGAFPVHTMDATYAGYFPGESAPVRLLKIDVEGHEHKAVMGAGRIIAKHRPVIAIETQHDSRAMKWLHNMGYSTHRRFGPTETWIMVHRGF